jgi:hypothetical protein
MGHILTEPELEILAELASPKKDFVNKYEREQHKKGFKYCARLFQMLGWKPNKDFYQKVKRELKPVKIKKQKVIQTRQYHPAINKSAIKIGM